jgi:hypothetical protein
VGVRFWDQAIPFPVTTRAEGLQAMKVQEHAQRSPTIASLPSLSYTPRRLGFTQLRKYRPFTGFVRKGHGHAADSQGDARSVGREKIIQAIGAKSVYVCYCEGWQKHVNSISIVEELDGCLAQGNSGQS